MNSVKIVEDFWVAVCKVSPDVDAIDGFVVDDSYYPGGVDIVTEGTDSKSGWRSFLVKVTDLTFEVRRHSKMRTSAAFALAGHGQKHSWALFQRLNTK